MATKDSRETDNSGNDYLDVLAGHFVRDTPARYFHQIDGYRYVKACNNIDKGNVPEANLQKVELHDLAPTPGPEEENAVKLEIKSQPNLQPAKRTSPRGVKAPFQFIEQFKAPTR